MAAAIRKKPVYLALAAVPLFFGIQQISEGFVWLALLGSEPEGARQPSLVFLFFALSFWPFWFPLFATVMETDFRRKTVLAVVSVAATSWFWLLYYPLLADPTMLLPPEIVHHSIQYRYPDLAIYEYISRPVLRILYVITLAVPQIVSSERWGRIPSLILLISALIASLVFEYAFVSVWCFFAAVMASYCCIVLYRMPGPAASQPRAVV